MSQRVGFALLVTAGALAPGIAAGQRPVELAFADPQPHFVAAWAPKKAREAERSAVLVQRVSLELADVSLNDALKELITAAKLNITYSPAVLPSGKRVTIKAGDIAVVTALTEMLFRSGLDVVVDRDGALALVVCRHPAPRAEVQDSGTIVGTVTDKATGAPIGGATVTVEGTKQSATTGTDGSYRIAGIELGTYTVRARYIGYGELRSTITVGEIEDMTADFALEKSVQKLDELVTVTPGGMQTELRALPSPVSIITADQIAQQRSVTLNEVLRQSVPSAVAWELPNSPVATQLSLRGVSSLVSGVGQVKIFVDGIESATLASNPVDPTSIEKMEVIRGPQAATVYGPDAAGGVIQISTKRGNANLARPELTARAEVGIQETPYLGFKGVGRQRLGAAIRGGAGGATYNLGVTYTRLGDWVPAEPSSQSIPSVYSGLHYTRGVISLDLSGRYLGTNNGAPFNPLLREAGFFVFSQPRLTTQRFVNHTLGARLGIVPTSWWRNHFTVGVDRTSLEQVSQPRLTTPADTFFSVGLVSSEKPSFSYNASFDRTLSSSLSGRLTLGLDYYRLLATNTNTSQALTTEATIRMPIGAPVNLARNVITNTGYFGQLELGFSHRFFLTVGLRADENSAFGEDTGAPLSPRLGAAYSVDFGDITLKARGSFGRAIRAPRAGARDGSVEATQVTLSNVLLKPERQRGWDGGFDLVFGSHGSLSLTGYDQTAQDLIIFVQLPDALIPTFQNQNVGGLRNRGIELEGAVLLSDDVQLRAQYAYVESRIRELGPDFLGDEQVGDRPRGLPAHTAGGALVFTPWSGTTITGGVTYVGRFPEYDFMAQLRCFGGTGPCRATNRDYIVDYPGFAKLDAAVDQRLSSQVSAYVSIVNLTNNQAYEASNFNPVTGRRTSAGIQLRY